MDSVGEDDPPEVSHSDQATGTKSGSVARNGKRGFRRAIVVGDSSVRGTDR